MPAATTGTPPSCSAPRAISPPTAPSTARSISCSSRRKKTTAAASAWSTRVCSTASRPRTSSHSTIGQACRSARSPPASARQWRRGTTSPFRCAGPAPPPPRPTSAPPPPPPPPCRIVAEAQAIVSRTVDPLASAVLSFTQIHGGNTMNVVPGEVTLAGTCRFLEASVGAHVAERLTRLCRAVGESTGIAVSVDYQKGYPPAINTAPAVAIAAAAAGNVFGPDRVTTELAPSMGSEDFAYMLAAQSGCYAWLDAGPATPGKLLHQPNYDFNDALLPLGVRYFVSVVETVLGKPSNR